MVRKTTLCVLAGLIILMCSSATAAIFVVTKTLDDGSPGTLRWAINQANISPVWDQINFSIPPGGLQTILVVGQLPALTDPMGVRIDGFTQPPGGTSGPFPPATLSLLIQLKGAPGGPPAHGLWVKSSHNRIQGLVINQFSQDGICIEAGPQETVSNEVYWNIIGLDPGGAIPMGNGWGQASLWAGVRICNSPYEMPNFAFENWIVENVISANYAEGVAIWGAVQPGDVFNNHVMHNYIGTDRGGVVDLGNQHTGVCLTEGTHNNEVAMNLISGNDWDGVSITGFNNYGHGLPIQTSKNIVYQNTVGMKVDLTPLPNGMNGVSVGGYGQGHFGCADLNRIGPSNLIADNGANGVMVWEDPINTSNADGNKITQNSHYDNTGLGIDLQDDGVTANDPGDGDWLANQQVNFPVIDSAIIVGTTTTIYGKVSIDSDPTQATVEVFKAALDPTGYGEGKTYLGSATPTNALGEWTFSITGTLVAGDSVTATTTDLGFNTSEFCLNAVVKVPAPQLWNCTTYPPPGKIGGGTEFEPNDQCPQANPANCEAAYCGVVNGPNDADWWVVTLPADTCYCLHVRVLADDTPNQYAFGLGLNPNVTIYASDCATQLFYNDDHNGLFPDAVGQDAQYDCQDQGNCYARGTTLYIKVAGLAGPGGDAGPYLLVINCERCECPATPIDTCDYYKLGYQDYCPNGMPDFDQKQNGWWFGLPPGAPWTHCGPVALANCMWWFDSKFESGPVDPRPFYPGLITPPKNDHYDLVKSYDGQGLWDDHDTNNVKPLVDSLAIYCKTNTAGSGTNVFDLATGAQNWITKAGLSSKYTVNIYPIDPAFGFEFLRGEILRSQDVILLLGFWEETAPGYCERIGGHYVTVAGTCKDLATQALCISDPYFDNNEPVGHASGEHNDAGLVSGPHGTNHHDRYDLMPSVCQPHPPNPAFYLELANYPVNAGNVMNFFGQNPFDPQWTPVPPTQVPIHTLVEWAVIICPVADTCDTQMPGDANSDGVINSGDVTYLTNYMKKIGPAPNPLSNGDCDGDCDIDWRDVQYLTAYVNGQGPAPVDCTCQPQNIITYCCKNIRGNANYDPLDKVNVTDVTYLLSYMFGIPSGKPPRCWEEGNANGDISEKVNVTDVTYLLTYLFGIPMGPPPPACPY